LIRPNNKNGNWLRERGTVHQGIFMSKQHNLHDCVRDSLHIYFQDLNGTDPAGLHDMLVKAVEKPLLEVVMQQSQNNQSRAAQWLGLNRNTLRKKLLEHGLIE
jgi:Fis family transcriptional regulator, factor for inversion stimulation protein